MKICAVVSSESTAVLKNIFEDHLACALFFCDHPEHTRDLMQKEGCNLLLMDAALFSEEELIQFVHRISSQFPVIVMVPAQTLMEREELILKGAQEVLPYTELNVTRAEHVTQLALLRYRREAHLHEAMQQSQKMEAVGRMASGIAHDYNNLLTIILNDAVLAREGLPEDSPIMEDIAEQIATIKRAAGLTRRLLVMSRGRPVPPERLDLLQVVDGMEKMFRHVTGDRVMLTVKHQSSNLPIHGDTVQIEQAMLNLVINACDAIWYEGSLHIETGLTDLVSEADSLYFGEPAETNGSYAMVRMVDSGCGIDEQNLAHIFEPFFTTKAEGSGTGLGLYQVYSTIKQHNGCIAVKSVPGKGTEISLFFKCEESCQSRLEEDKMLALPHGSENILLVEDDNTVRRTTARLLKRLGYHVAEACGADEALSLSAQQLSEMHLLLTDVMMPKMNGLELANRLKTAYPELRILLASGYPEARLSQHGLLPEKYAFISKPFFRDRLAVLIRQLLDQ